MHSEMTNMLTSTFGRLLVDQHPASRARQASDCDLPVQQALWRELAEGGWLEVGCPTFQEEHGAHTLMIGELVGSALLTLPYTATAFLAEPLLAAAKQLADMEIVLPTAVHPASVRCGNEEDEAWIDTFGTGAQYLQLIKLSESKGWRLSRYQPTAVSPFPSLDPGVALGRLDGHPVKEVLLTDAQVLPVLQRFLAVELAQIIGAAGTSLDGAIAYAKDREQFGRPIGQFQAVKHALVNAWLDRDDARYAVQALLAGQTVDGQLAALANRLTTRAAKQACKLAIQVHGGIGFAWEHEAHLYLKRVYRLAIGSERVARLLAAENSQVLPHQ